MDARVTREHDQRKIADLAAEITELAGDLNAANSRLLKLIAEFDRRTGGMGVDVLLQHARREDPNDPRSRSSS